MWSSLFQNSAWQALSSMAKKHSPVMTISVCTWVYLCVTAKLFLLFGTTAHTSRRKLWNNGKKTGCWTSGFPRELTDVFQNIPLVCENGKLPVVKTGVSIQFLLLQWRTLRFAFAASKEIMFSSLWDNINCSSSNGSFFTAKKMCRIRESEPRVW